jgi:alpha-amylase
MKLTRFILAVHCHQPVGNFGWVFEEAYQSAYRPFVDVLERHPKVRVVFHYSGPLLDWFEARHPDFLKRLKKLVQRGQAEFLGSGYYEPVLILLPEKDALGQLAWMERALGRLGLEPKGSAAHGIWLAERVWEPGLVRLLAQAGIKYTVVDDNHLALAGVPENERFGYYLTEDRGASVAVFPSSKPLRYAVPFKQVEEVIDLLKGYASERQQTVVLGDDGEKFGLWPGTHKWVYEEGWLERFFTALEQNADWLKMTTFREALGATTPLGRVYMPVSSYEEMVGWSRGTFRNFLAK